MTDIRDLIAGMFVLVALVLFLVFLAWAGDLAELFAERREVRVLLKNAVPLANGAPVRYEGLLVGQVRTIRLRTEDERRNQHADHHVLLEITVQADVPVTKQTRVEVTADGLLGARFVDMRAAPAGTDELPADEALLGHLGGVDAFLTRMDELAGSVTVALDRLAKLLDPSAGGSVPGLVNRAADLTGKAGSLVDGLETTRQSLDGGIAQATAAIGSVRTLVDDAKPRVSELLRRLEALPADAQGAVAELRTLLEKNRDRVASLLDEGSTTVVSLRGTIETLGDEITRTLGRLDDLMARNDRNIFMTLHHLRVAAEELKVAAARIRADPSQVLFGGSENPDTAEAAARKSQERDLLDKGALPPRWKR